MPSIWITSRSSLERSDAIHSFMRAADSATKWREAADFDTPDPAGAGTSPSGNRTERPNLRVETLISIRFIAHLPSQSSATASSQLGRACSLPSKPAKPRPLDLDLAAVEADLAPRLPPAMRPPVMTSRMAWPTDRSRIVFHHLAKRLDPGSQAEPLEARRHLRQRLDLQALVGMAVDVVESFMALLSFVESAPRAYRLKASNAAPPISTSPGHRLDNPPRANHIAGGAEQYSCGLPDTVIARDGGLLSYGADFQDIFHRAARYVDQIFRGAKPQNSPSSCQQSI